jgi:MFS family permease
MYLSTVNSPVAARSRRWGAVSANVIALGAVSLVTDVSAEMVTAVLPVYLVVGLQLSPSAYGVVNGVYSGATVLLRLVGGYVADRVRRRKAVAGIGYALSALAKLGLLAAGTSIAAIGAVIAVDRAGKGLRTAPRDALITLSSPADRLGRAFGVHRAMDSLGAFAGPLVALAVLAAAGHRRYDAVFMTSFCVAAFGVLVLAMFVQDRRSAAPAVAVSPSQAAGLLRDRGVRRLVVATGLLGAATVGDGFVYLMVQQRTGLAVGWFPMLAVGTSLAYLLLAAPLGLLADRVGRLPVVLAGYGALTAVYLVLFTEVTGWPLIIGVLALYGLFYAATDGVLMALAAPLLPESLRTTGLALIQTMQALALLGASIGFGFAWQAWGATLACLCAAILTVAAMAAVLALLVRSSRRADAS